MARGNNDYFELLKRPEWQRKRLEVMELAGFACEMCEDSDRTLNVHHAFYEKDLKPWEYPLESLHCVCEDCHKMAQALYTSIKRQLGCLDFCETTQLYGYAKGLECLQFPNTQIDINDPSVDDGPYFTEGIGDAWGLPLMEIVRAAKDGVIDGYLLHGLRDELKHSECLAALASDPTVTASSISLEVCPGA